MSKLDRNIYPNYYIGYIDPEDFCDNIQYHMGCEGVEMSEATYASLWEDVERYNKLNSKKRLTEEDKYLSRYNRNKLEAVNE